MAESSRTTAPTSGHVEVLETAPPARSRPSMRARVVTAGVTALLAGGIGAWMVLGDGADDDEPIAAVTSEPALVWTHQAGGELKAVLGVGDDEILALTADDLTLLDRDGRERWSADAGIDDPDGVYGEPGSDIVLAFAWGDDGHHVAAFSRAGESLWSTDAETVYVGEHHVLVSDDETLRRLDARTGDEEWTVAVDGPAAADEDAVVVVHDGALRRIDAATGDELWSADLRGDVDDYSRAMVRETFALFVGQSDGAEAFDLESGEPLWTAETLTDGVTVGAAADDEVYVVDVDYDEVKPGRFPVRVFDAEGEVDDFVATTPYFLGPVRDAGETYLVNVDGQVYDGDFEQVGERHEGDIEVVEGGFYLLDDSALAYYGFEDAEPTWTVEDDFEDTVARSLAIRAADRMVLVVDGDELLAYR